MRKLMFFVVALVAFASSSFAGGDIYFGKYFDSKFSSRPWGLGKKASFISGIRLDKEFNLDQPFLERITPYIKLETLMDGYNGNGSFHPASIKYDVGLNIGVFKGTYLDISRMCFHPIDGGGPVEEYWLVKGGYRW